MQYEIRIPKINKQYIKNLPTKLLAKSSRGKLLNLVLLGIFISALFVVGRVDVNRQEYERKIDKYYSLSIFDAIKPEMKVSNEIMGVVNQVGSYSDRKALLYSNVFSSLDFDPTVVTDKLNERLNDIGFYNSYMFWTFSTTSISATYYWKEDPSKYVYISVSGVDDYNKFTQLVQREKLTGRDELPPEPRTLRVNGEWVFEVRVIKFF